MYTSTDSDKTILMHRAMQSSTVCNNSNECDNNKMLDASNNRNKIVVLIVMPWASSFAPFLSADTPTCAISQPVISFEDRFCSCLFQFHYFFSIFILFAPLLVCWCFSPIHFWCNCTMILMYFIFKQNDLNQSTTFAVCTLANGTFCFRLNDMNSIACVQFELMSSIIIIKFHQIEKSALIWYFQQ